MTANDKLEIIHIVWDGPKTVEEAVAANTGDDYGVDQIYGMHEASGPDALLDIGQADAGIFSGRIVYHQQEWGRWNPDLVRVYLGRLAGVRSITNEEWGHLIDRAEAVLIWKIGVPFNSSRIRSLKYQEQPILVVNHGRRHRLPECLSTLTEFINPDQDEFKNFGPSGHHVFAPVPQPREACDEE